MNYNFFSSICCEVVPNFWWGSYWKANWGGRHISTFYLLLQNIFSLRVLNLVGIPVVTWRHLDVWMDLQIFLGRVPCVKKDNRTFWLEAFSVLWVWAANSHWFFGIIGVVLYLCPKILALIRIDQGVLHLFDVQCFIEHQYVVPAIFWHVSCGCRYNRHIFHWCVLVW